MSDCQEEVADDVAALTEGAKDTLGLLGEYPLTRAERRGEAELLELPGAGGKRTALDVIRLFGEGPKIFVDRKSFVFLRGTTLDFEGGLNGKGFTFVNPNAKSSCGCGSSFSA